MEAIDGRGQPWLIYAVAACSAPAAWIVVGAVTLLQRRTPARLQGRVYSAADLLLGAPQTASIATGAALVAVVGYPWLLVAEAAVFALAGAYLGQQVLRGARELEDHRGLRFGRRRRLLRLGDDGAHAVEGLGKQRGGRDVGDLHAGGIGARRRSAEPGATRLDG